MDGFCGKKEHKCQSHFLVTVGEGIVGYELITDAFKNCVIGHYARVIIENPLHEKLPHFVWLFIQHATSLMQILSIDNGKK